MKRVAEQTRVTHDAVAQAIDGNFLFVLPWDLEEVGGVNTVVGGLMTEEIERDRLPVLLVSSWKRPRVRLVGPHGIVSFRLPLRAPVKPSARLRSTLSFFLTLPLMVIRLSRLVRAHRVAVVNAHFPGPDLFVFTVMRSLGLLRSSIVLSIHGQDVDRLRASKGLERKVLEVLYSSADSVLACSEHLARSFLKEFPHLGGRTRVVWNGVDAKTIQEGAKAGTLPRELHGVSYILSVGTFEEKKGHDVLLQAFARVASSRPDLHLVIVGRSGPTLPSLEEYRSGCGLSERMHFFKDVPHESIGPFYANATMVVLPSRREPFGIAGLEAGVFGKPLVASRVGGIPEYVRDGVNGILVPADDASTLAGAVERLLNNPALGTELGHRLRREVLTRFSRARMWRGYLTAAGFEVTET